ncbi:MAG: GNAT family N-acetyltransferase [Clostridia bacterium]|nr:GNAT family N-acetyltransferase [Clostridia bacterium]
MKVVKARYEQLDEILEIYASARRFMRESGNTEQWSGGYPSREVLEHDVAQEQLYLCVEDGEILGVFCYFEGIDPTYVQIFDGTWLNDHPYGVMHRVAVAKRGRGVASFCFAHCFEQCKNMKIDTHKDNLPMQRALERNGFVRCGIIHLENGDPRIAYQRCGT